MNKALKVVLAVLGLAVIVTAAVFLMPKSLYTVDIGKHHGHDWKGSIKRSSYWQAYIDYIRAKPDFAKPAMHFTVTSNVVSGMESYSMHRYVLRATAANGALIGEGTLDSKPEGLTNGKLAELANYAAASAYSRRLATDPNFAQHILKTMPTKSLEEVQMFCRVCEKAGKASKPLLPALMDLLDHPDTMARQAVLASLKWVTPKSDTETWSVVYEKLLSDQDANLYAAAWEEVLTDGKRNADRIGRLALDRTVEAERQNALYALMVLGPAGSAAGPHLAKLIKDPDCPRNLRRPAVLAMAAMMSGDPVVMAALRDVAKDENHIAADIAKQGFFAHTLPGSIWRVHNGGEGYRFEFRGNGRYKVRSLKDNSVGYGNYRFKKAILLAGRIRGELAIDSFNEIVAYKPMWDSEDQGRRQEGRWHFHREQTR